MKHPPKRPAAASPLRGAPLADRRSRIRGGRWNGHALRVALLALAVCLTGPVLAQAVALSGMLGSKALLVVDGGAPRGVAPGETHGGVKVISAAGDQAVVEVGGKRQTLRVGDAPVSVGGRGNTGGNRVVLTAGSGGHFMSQGTINGRAVQFMVDTGATSVALSAADAERIGLKYQSGQPVRMGTANGVTQGWRMKLSSVRLGDVEVYEVDAVVTQQPMPFVLLGNSFLTRFQMKRENDQMTLERRY
jgi:aspartyl protease family protein